MSQVKGITIRTLLSTSVADRESGRLFLQLMLSQAPQYSPEKYNYYEPLNHVFDPDNIDEALACWRDDFLWRRSKPAVAGSAWFGFRNVHDSVSLKVGLKAFDKQAVMRLLASLATTFGIDLAYVHVATDEDVADLDHYRRQLMPLAQGVTTHDLRDGIPDMPWAILFGAPYVELFGRDRMMQTPAHQVEPVGGGIYVQLTSDPADAAKNRDAYLAAQRAAKQHLNSNAFRELTTTSCRVPEFFLVSH